MIQKWQDTCQRLNWSNWTVYQLSLHHMCLHGNSILCFFVLTCSCRVTLPASLLACPWGRSPLCSCCCCWCCVSPLYGCWSALWSMSFTTFTFRRLRKVMAALPENPQTEILVNISTHMPFTWIYQLTVLTEIRGLKFLASVVFLFGVIKNCISKLSKKMPPRNADFNPFSSCPFQLIWHSQTSSPG